MGVMGEDKEGCREGCTEGPLYDPAIALIVSHHFTIHTAHKV